MSITIVNLTPHPLVLQKTDGTFLRVSKPVAGTALPRRAIKTEACEPIEGLPVVKTVLGPVENAPEAVEGTIYIVPRLVADALPERTDLFAPGEAIRDDEGKVIGAKGLAR